MKIAANKPPEFTLCFLNLPKFYQCTCEIIVDYLTQRVTIICTGSEGGFRGWGQNDTSWSYPWYEVSKNVFAKAVLSLVAEFQKLLKIMPFLGEISSKVS